MHAANKHGHRQHECGFLKDEGSCGGCPKLFHNKRRLLRHLADQKDKSCIGRLSTNFAPCLHGTEKSKYGKGFASSAVHRTGPPREEDRRLVQQCEGPLLYYGLLQPLPNPSAIYFAYIDPPVPSRADMPVHESYKKAC